MQQLSWQGHPNVHTRDSYVATVGRVSSSGHTGLNHPRQTPRSPNHPSLRVVSRERETAPSTATGQILGTCDSHNQPTEVPNRSPTHWPRPGRRWMSCLVLSWSYPAPPTLGWSRVRYSSGGWRGGIKHLIMNEYCVRPFDSVPLVFWIPCRMFSRCIPLLKLVLIIILAICH